MYKGFRRIFGRRRSSSIFERFTERTRKAMVLAREEAGRFRHSLESARRDVELPEFTPNQSLFRRRVESLRIAVRPGDQPQTPLVDLDHIYALRDTEDASRALNHDDILTGVAGVALEAGEHLLESLPAVREITVGATKQRILEAHAISGFTLKRTFRR